MRVRGGATLVTVIALIAVIAVGVADAGWAPPPTAPKPRVRAAVAATATRLDRALRAAPFVENRGQADHRARYLLRGRAASVAFVAGGPMITLAARGPSASRWTVQQRFIGGREAPVPVGTTPLGATMSYFRGGPGSWVTRAPTFARVAYRRVWPGIDVEYSAADGALEYTFLLSPGADPRDIRLAYRGASSVALGPHGALRVRTPAGPFADAAPVAYQTIGGRRRVVRGAFVPRGGPGFGFDVGSYDRRAPLVIDPVSIAYAGYVGGSGLDQGLAATTDGAGNAYVVGQTKSDERTFPVKVGPDLTLNGQTDAFVCKIGPAAHLVYCGYIGGSEPDRGRGVAVDPAGEAYVYGWTRSKEKDGFPVTVGPDLTYNGGTSDTFVCKVDAGGTALVFCGYIGGDRHDEGKAIALDASGAAYVTGGTKSPDMPITPGSFGETYSGDGDVFVAKVAPDGTALAWLGYVGGVGSEHARGIGVAYGSVSFAATTDSDERSLPVKVGPDLTYNGGGDAVVGRITPDGSALTYLGYVGGSGFDDARSGTVGGAGNLFLCGHTASTQATFPVKVGPDLTYNGGARDGFVAEAHPDGTLAVAGYIGGRASDACYGIDVDHDGAMFVSGRTFSSQTSFPAKLGPDLTYNGGGDAYAAKVAVGGASIVYCGYVGGIGKDVSWATSVDGDGAAILAGQTYSSQSSFPVRLGPDLTYNGGGDAFVAEVVP